MSLFPVLEIAARSSIAGAVTHITFPVCGKLHHFLSISLETYASYDPFSPSFTDEMLLYILQSLIQLVHTYVHR